MKTIGIYVHIPFCERKCAYCNFISFTGKQDCYKSYCMVMLNEIKNKANKNYLVDTIYIGGGTPSVLDFQSVGQIIEQIKQCFTVSKNAEITIEVNPNSVTKQKAIAYLSYGINRVSVGVQSLKNSCLKVLGRLHNSKQATQTLKMLKEVGFKNISCDLMLAIPKLTIFAIKREIKLLSKYCNHISAYSLILEENTPLFAKVQSKNAKLPSEVKAVKQYKTAHKMLEKCGFSRYEVSNFAITGYESRHNLKYWDLQEYLAFGVAGHSFFNGERIQNPENLQDYFDYVNNNNKSLQIIEKTTKESLKEEAIMLGLRKTQGINLLAFNKAFDCDLLIDKKEQIKSLKSLGLIEIANNYLHATDKGFYVLNQIIIKLID